MDSIFWNVLNLITFVIGFFCGLGLTDVVNEWFRIHGKRKQVDFDKVDFTHPYAKRYQIESCNTIRFKVKEFSTQQAIMGYIPEFPQVEYVSAYLPIKDLLQIQVGNEVIARGKIVMNDYGNVITINVKNARMCRVIIGPKKKREV